MGRDGPEVKPAKVNVVSITFDGKYRIDATINQENMLQRIHTWVAHPVLGDMNYEHEFTNASYIDLGNGMRFPESGTLTTAGTTTTARRTSPPATTHSADAEGHPRQRNVPARRDGARFSGARPPFPVRVETQKLADGVYLIGGGSHNSVAVEFKDFIAVFEAPLDEERSLAVIEADRQADTGQADPVGDQFPSALRSCRRPPHLHAHRRDVITHWKNYDFYNRDVLNYAQRTLKPDMLSLWPPTELAEGYYYEPSARISSSATAPGT